MNIHKFLILLVISYVSLFSVSAQERNPTPYYFDEFKQALLIGKGVQYGARVNFDLISKQWKFVDTGDRNLVKAFSDPDAILIIKIDNKTYLMSEFALIECIQSEPYLCVEYNAITRNAPRSISYGGETQTAAVDSYAGLLGTGSDKRLTPKIVIGLTKRYEVKIGRKSKHFFDSKSFVKLFDKRQRPEVEAYLGSNPIDFANVEDVTHLVNYYWRKL